MYLCLRDLYHQLRSGVIDRNTGIADKQRIAGEYDRLKRRTEFGHKCLKHYSVFFKNVQFAMSAYRKERTIENADILVSVIDGTGMPKCEVFKGNAD